MSTSSVTPQIEGLPAGVSLRPIGGGGGNIEGLPPGVTLRQIGGSSVQPHEYHGGQATEGAYSTRPPMGGVLSRFGGGLVDFAADMAHASKTHLTGQDQEDLAKQLTRDSALKTGTFVPGSPSTQGVPLGQGIGQVLTLPQIAEREQRGDYAGAAGYAVPTAIMSVMTGRAGVKALTKTPVKAAAAQTEALGSLIDSRGGAVDPHAMASDVLPVIRQQLAADKVNVGKLGGRAAGQAVLKSVNNAIQAHSNEVGILSQPHASAIVDQAPIAAAYRSKITPELQANEPAVATRLEAEAKKFDQPTTLQRVNELRVRLNRETAAAQGKAEGGLRKTDLETQADVAAVQAARQVQYDNLARLSGTPVEHIRWLQKTEGQLLETRDSLTKGLNRASAEHAEAVSKSMREKLTGAYPSQRGLTHAVVKATVGPKPLDVFNNRLQTAFGGVGEQTMAPQVTQPSPVSVPSEATVAAEGQGGHAGGDVSSVEELSRPGANYVVSRSGQLTYHGKAFAPESTPAGSTHVTALPDGTFRVNAGQALTPVQQTALEKAVPRRVASPTPPAVAGGRVTPEHVAQENAYYTQARAELGANADPTTVLRRAQQIKLAAQAAPTAPTPTRIAMPRPPAAAAAPRPQVGGATRQAAVAAIMSSLKRGDITQHEADRRIQRLTGGGGRKLVRMPAPP
jgi:hypothetical protein